MRAARIGLRGSRAPRAGRGRPLGRPGGRPVSRFHAEKTVERMPGVADLVALAVSEAEGVGDPALRAEVQAAAEVATSALDAWVAWGRIELVPSATGDFRLGPELYAAKFRHSLKTVLTPAQLETRALAEYDAVRAEMTRIARRIWPDWLGSTQP